MTKIEMTYEEAVQKMNQSKNDLKTATKELNAFRKANQIKRGEEPEDAKLKKEFNGLMRNIEKLEKEVEAITAKVKELKPATARTTKYEYPEVKDEKSGQMREMTAQEKKKFRAKARSEKKKLEKGEEKGEEKGSKKASESQNDTTDKKAARKARRRAEENTEDDD